MKTQLLRLVLMFTLAGNPAIPGRAAEESTLPELLTFAAADCDQPDFIRIASGFPLNSEELATIEIAARRLSRLEQDSAEKKHKFCQYVLRLIENRRPFDVLTWDSSKRKLEWLHFTVTMLKAQMGERQETHFFAEGDRNSYCPDAPPDGKVTIRGVVEDCGVYSPTSQQKLYCHKWGARIKNRRLAQLEAVKAPSQALDPMRRVTDADEECYAKAISAGASGWSPAYECAAADKLSPVADSAYRSYAAAHPFPWKTQKEECAALKPKTMH